MLVHVEFTLALVAFVAAIITLLLCGCSLIR